MGPICSGESSELPVVDVVPGIQLNAVAVRRETQFNVEEELDVGEELDEK